MGLMSDSKSVNLRVAAKAVIIKDNKILLLREADTYREGTNIGAYGLPGGRIEADEPFFDGLRREIREETGLEIEIGAPVSIGEWWPVINGVKNHIVAMFIRCEPLPGEIRLSDPNDVFVWVGVDQLPEYGIMPPDD